MFIENENYYSIEEFEKFNIKAVYTKKNAGNMSDYCSGYPENNGHTQETNRIKMLEILGASDKIQIQSFQTHTNKIINITDEITDYTYEEVDGFITNRKDVALFTFYADCLPIFVYDKRNAVIGVWHSGWQGSYKEIMSNGINLMKKEYGTNPEDLIVGLGIGISIDNYEVGVEFYNKFVEKFGIEDERIERSFIKGEGDKYFFNNTEFNKITALKLGIKEENLVISNENTWNEEFHSYRRDREKSGRAAGIIFFNFFS